MRAAARSITLFAALLSAAGLWASPRSNDFTKAARDGDRRFNSSPWSSSGKTFSGADKSMTYVRYVAPSDARDFGTTLFRAPDGGAAGALSARASAFGGMGYSNIPDYSRHADKVWGKASNTPALRNLDRDLGRDYSGRLDPEKLSLYNKQLKAATEQVQKHSLREINKFFSLGHGAADGTIPVTVAGEQTGEGVQSSSILSAMGMDTANKVDRPALSLTKPLDFKTGARGGPQTASPQAGRGATPQPAQQKTKIAEQVVLPAKQGGGMFGVSKEMQGGAKITVEVKQ